MQTTRGKEKGKMHLVTSNWIYPTYLSALRNPLNPSIVSCREVAEGDLCLCFWRGTSNRAVRVVLRLRLRLVGSEVGGVGIGGRGVTVAVVGVVL
jgi:hypothetical protein